MDGRRFHIRPARQSAGRSCRSPPAYQSGREAPSCGRAPPARRPDTDEKFLREALGVEFARERIAAGAVVSADEVTQWSLLEQSISMQRVTYSGDYGVRGIQTNVAESVFSRLGRMIGGQHLKVDGRYVDAHAAHAAWREDHREESNGRLADRLIGGALASAVSRPCKGYWQRQAE